MRIFAVLVRRWPVVLAGAVLTVGAGLWAISDPGVYSSRTTLAFLAPANAANPNALRTSSDAVIETAGLVAKRMTGPGEVTKYASTDVTLVGLGVTDGWWLRAPDTGGQWATDFATQTLLLDVVGPSRQVVEERRDALVLRTAQELYLLQRDAGVDPKNAVTMVPAPESPILYHVQGNRVNALAMTGLLGVGATVAAVLALERRRRVAQPVATSAYRGGEPLRRPLSLSRAG